MELPKRLKEFVPQVTAICAAQFPKQCNTCGHIFNNFQEFVVGSKNLGTHPNHHCNPGSLIAYRNCPCGSTITISCTNADIHKVFHCVLDEEVKVSGRSAKDLLLVLLCEVDSLALEPDSPR